MLDKKTIVALIFIFVACPFVMWATEVLMDQGAPGTKPWLFTGTFAPVGTSTPTPVLAKIAQGSLTTASSATPTPIATAVAGAYNHTQWYFVNTGTAGDTFNVYQGSSKFSYYLAPGGGTLVKSLVDTQGDVPISISGPATNAGCTISYYGLLDQQSYQVPINLIAP
jgi:hypothetical protein